MKKLRYFNSWIKIRNDIWIVFDDLTNTKSYYRYKNGKLKLLKSIEQKEHYEIN